MEEKKLKLFLGYNIKKLREKAGLTQERLCNLISLEQPSLSQIETGKSLPTLKTLISIIIALKVSADSILDFLDKYEKIEVIDDTDIKITKHMLNLPAKTKRVVAEIFNENN